MDFGLFAVSVETILSSLLEQAVSHNEANSNILFTFFFIALKDKISIYIRYLLDLLK
jgi:hypothetical protein